MALHFNNAKRFGIKQPQIIDEGHSLHYSNHYFCRFVVVFDDFQACFCRLATAAAADVRSAGGDR
jgi:hypothetical protein